MSDNDYGYRPEEEDWYRKEYQAQLLEATYVWERAIESVAQPLIVRGWPVSVAYECAVYEVGAGPIEEDL